MTILVFVFETLETSTDMTGVVGCVLADGLDMANNHVSEDFGCTVLQKTTTVQNMVCQLLVVLRKVNKVLDNFCCFFICRNPNSIVDKKKFSWVHETQFVVFQ